MKAGSRRSNARVERARMELPCPANGATCHDLVVDEPPIASLTLHGWLLLCYLVVHCGQDDYSFLLTGPELDSMKSPLAPPHSCVDNCIDNGVCCMPPLTLRLGSTRAAPLPAINRSCAAEAATMSLPIAYLP
jgi:hypothetical protein